MSPAPLDGAHTFVRSVTCGACYNGCMRQPYRKIALIILPVVVAWYFLAEYLVAAAWPTPGYSYIHNYVSDLGVPICSSGSRFVCSPWHDMMNMTFFVVGLGSLVGMIALASLFHGARRYVVGLLGTVQSIGIMLVGIAPGSFAEDITHDTTQMFLHSLGALLAILGTCVTALVVGALLWRQSRRFALISLLLGAAPFVLLALQALTGIENLGLGRGGFERVGVYAAMVWIACAGIYGILVLRRRDN